MSHKKTNQQTQFQAQPAASRSNLTIHYVRSHSNANQVVYSSNRWTDLKLWTTRQKKRAFCWLSHQSTWNNSDTSESMEDQKKRTHSWNSNSTHSNLREQKSSRNKNSEVLFHRKSYITKWTSIGVRDFFQWLGNQSLWWILETWGSGLRAVVYNELPNNKIEFQIIIYLFIYYYVFQN